MTGGLVAKYEEKTRHDDGHGVIFYNLVGKRNIINDNFPEIEL